MNHSLALTFLAGSMLTACGPLSGPSEPSSINPLDLAGGEIAKAKDKAAGFEPGQFVNTRIDGTAFFKEIPKGDAVADQLLDMGTPMKVIESDESFTKVELDSGVIGYVLTVVLEPATIDEPVAIPNPQPKSRPMPEVTLPALPPTPL